MSLAISMKSRARKKDHFVFNVATNIRLVNNITSMIEESKLISENAPPNVIHC